MDEDEARAFIDSVMALWARVTDIIVAADELGLLTDLGVVRLDLR